MVGCRSGTGGGPAEFLTNVPPWHRADIFLWSQIVQKKNQHLPRPFFLWFAGCLAGGGWRRTADHVNDHVEGVVKEQCADVRVVVVEGLVHPEILRECVPLGGSLRMIPDK